MTDMLDSTKMKEDLDKNVEDALNEAIKEVGNQNPIVDDASATLQEPDTGSNHSTSPQQGTRGSRNPNPQQEQPENSASSDSTESTIRYPNIKSDFFESITSKKNWWEDNKLFIAFGLLVLLAGFVLYKVICENPCEYQYSSSYLFFLFGIITMLFVVLGVLAYLIIKESAKHRSEKDERENKQLAFRQKMMEMVFGLENRNLIDEKLKQEKTISKDEKEVLYSLEENLRMAEHNRKMQLRKYDFLENYLKNEFELAKISEKNTIKLGKDFEATMTSPVEKIERVPKSGEEKEYYKITFEKDK